MRFLMGSRRRSREMALQLLFQSEFSPKKAPDEWLEKVSEHFEISPEERAYSQLLIDGYYQHKEKIDSAIQKCSAHWKVARMAMVDLNIMRLATFEMKYMDPPLSPGVVINESVEIAKRFSEVGAASFINGVLDQISKT